VVQTLPNPAPLKKDVMRIIPLGGIGEIGRNMTVFEINGKILIVDCGVLFPEEHQPGVDVILPDFGYLKNRLDDIRSRGPHRGSAISSSHAR
jgi:ribonuclease J